MFSRKNRALSTDFSAKNKKAGVFSSKNLSLLVFSNDSSESKFTVQVSKKVSPNAVDRNKNKRRVREAIKRAISNKTLKNGIFLIILKKDLNNTDFKGIILETEGLLSPLFK